MTTKNTKKKTTAKPAKIESAFDGLSDKHKLFVMNHIKNMGNQTRAYMDTYPNAQYDTARAKSSELVSKDNVKRAIDEKNLEVYADIMTDLEKNKTYQLIKSIGDSTIADVIDLEGGSLKVKSLSDIPETALHSIQSIAMDEKDGSNGYSKNLKVTMHNKLNALKARAEIQKLIDPKAEVQKLEIIVKPAQRPDDKEE